MSRIYVRRHFLAITVLSQTFLGPHVSMRRRPEIDERVSDPGLSLVS